MASVETRNRTSYQRASREANRAAILEREHAYYAANRGARYRARNRHRRAQLSAAPVDWRARQPETIALTDEWSLVGMTDTDWAEVLRRDPCAYCGGSGAAIDHIDPLASGGSDSWVNLTAACKSYNSRKHTKSLLEAL